MEVKPGYKMTDVGIIPEDWVVKPLGTLVNFTNGKAHEQSINDEGRFVVVNSKFISTEGSIRKYTNNSFCPATKGDVLMVMSDVPNGRAIAKCYIVENDHTYTVNQRICILTPRNIEGKFLFYILDRNPFYLSFDDGTKQTNLRRNEVLACPLGIPKSETEQRTIAAALSDVDALLSGLDRLIAKKRDLKQAAMQQLLTGKTRLPGFNGVWEVNRLGDVCQIVTGKKDVNEGSPSGQFPFFTCSRTHTYSDSFSFDTEAILIAGNGEVGNLHYYNGKFEAYQRTYVLQNIKINVRYLWQQLSVHLADSLGLGKVGSSIPYIKRENLTDFEFLCPLDPTEQTAIAAVLSDMDAELAALEARRDKTRDLKQAMMQELLTGKIRLM